MQSMHPALVCAEQAQGWPQSTPPEKKKKKKSHPGFAVNKTGDDMKPDTGENTHIPVISSRGKESVFTYHVKLGYYLHEVFMSVIFRVCVISNQINLIILYGFYYRFI